MNPYLYVAGALILAVLVAGAYTKGRSDGGRIESAKWEMRENEINAATAKLIQDRTDAVRKQEREKADNLADIAAHYEERLHETTITLDAALADARTRRLSIPATCAPASGNAARGIAAAPGVSDGQARTYLPDSIAESLLRIGAEADAVVNQLTACQQVILEDRR